MNSGDPEILCFQHVKSEPKNFCFNFPEICKFCHCSLLKSELEILPFRVPYPFKRSSVEYNTIVIKPTFGDFLNNYENSSDLHIGVTDSEGFVIEYDLNGLKRSKAHSWEQCLSIKILQPMTSSLKNYWDNILYKNVSKCCWTKERYDAESYNCYSFVLSFLQSLHLKELEPYVCDKVIFCQHYVCPQARVAAKYISIFRQLQQNIA